MESVLIHPAGVIRLRSAIVISAVISSKDRTRGLEFAKSQTNVVDELRYAAAAALLGCTYPLG